MPDWRPSACWAWRRAEGCAVLPGPDVISDKMHHGLAMPSGWRGISRPWILQGWLYHKWPLHAGRLRSCLSREERGLSPAEVFLLITVSPDGYGMSPESLALVGATPCQAPQGSSPLLSRSPSREAATLGPAWALSLFSPLGEMGTKAGSSPVLGDRADPPVTWGTSSWAQQHSDWAGW